MSVISDAISFLEVRVDEPALSHPALPEDIKAKVRQSKIRLNSFKRVGDLYIYLSRFTLEDGSSQNLKTHSILKAHHLETYEDVLPDFKSKFIDHIQDVTTIDDFVIGEKYSSWDISNFARNYENQRGILAIGQDGAHHSVFIKATLDGGKYSNEWIIPDVELKYYFFKLKDSYSPDYKNNRTILDFPDLPIYVFIRESGEYRLNGIFEFAEAVYPEDGKNWFRLRRSDDKVPGAVFFEPRLHTEFEKKVSDAKSLPGDELQRRIAKAKETLPRRVPTVSYQFQRNPYVVAYVLKRANGTCEECKKPAPFFRKTDGTPYLEVHHKIQLANNGQDSIENAIAVCPNCHRRLHFG